MPRLLASDPLATDWRFQRSPSNSGCQLLPVLDWLATDQTFPWPSLGLIHLLQQITEQRETFYLVDYQFTKKGYNSGTARWKRRAGPGCGGRGLRALSKHNVLPPPPRVHPPVFSNPVLLVFAEASLHRHVRLTHEPPVSDSISGSSLSPEVRRVARQVPPLSSQSWLFWQPGPNPRQGPKVLINSKRQLLTVYGQSMERELMDGCHSLRKFQGS